MPYIPHTQADVDAMLTDIGVENVDALFDEAAPEHDVAPFVFEEMPEALNEAGITRVMRARSQRDAGVVPFIVLVLTIIIFPLRCGRLWVVVNS